MELKFKVGNRVEHLGSEDHSKSFGFGTVVGIDDSVDKSYLISFDKHYDILHRGHGKYIQPTKTCWWVQEKDIVAEMKIKVGTRVNDPSFGLGTVVAKNVGDSKMSCLVCFDTIQTSLHSASSWDEPHKNESRYWFYYEEDLEEIIVKSKFLVGTRVSYLYGGVNIIKGTIVDVEKYDGVVLVKFDECADWCHVKSAYTWDHVKEKRYYYFKDDDKNLKVIDTDPLANCCVDTLDKAGKYILLYDGVNEDEDMVLTSFEALIKAKRAVENDGYDSVTIVKIIGQYKRDVSYESFC